MPCVRCEQDAPLNPKGWCAACDRAYDSWVRRYATDVIWPSLVGMVLVAGIGMGIPLLGISYLVALSGIFVGGGAIAGLYVLNAKRRRKQFLLSGPLPRAYLPTKT